MVMEIPQDQYVQAGGVNTRFWSVGDDGTPMVLLHPGLGAVDNWKLNMNGLAKGHRVYAIDMLGFGYTGLPEPPYSLPKAAQHLCDFLDAQSIERVNLVGHCGGGVVSMYFAFQFPERLEKLVLVNSWGLGKEVPFITRLGTLPVIGDLIMRPTRTSAAMIMKMCVFNRAVLTDDIIDDAYRRMALPGAQKAYMSVFRAIGDFGGPRREILSFIRNNLPKISAPTLIVWGKQDRSLPVAHAEVAKNCIPHAELKIFDPCGHLPPMEYPQEFNKLILDFLAR